MITIDFMRTEYLLVFDNCYEAKRKETIQRNQYIFSGGFYYKAFFIISNACL